MGAWTPYSGAAVITSATGAWQDLDMSAIVGTNVAVVVLRLADVGPITVRAKGSAEENPSPAVSGTKGNGFAENSAGRHSYLLTKTNNSGVIQYVDPSGVGWTQDVFLEGYFIPNDGTTRVSLAAPGVGITTAWDTRFIHILNRPPEGKTSLFQQAFVIDNNSIAFAIRPEGETGNYWKGFAGNYYLGANGFRTFNVVPFTYPYYTAIADTGPTGSYDMAGDGVGTLYESSTYWSEWDYYVKSRNTIYSAQVFPIRSVAWLATDLSPYVGQRECLAVLRLSVDSGGAAGSYGAARKYGSADTANDLATFYGPGLQEIGSDPGNGAIIICPTDNLGRIEVAATQAGKTFDLEILGFVGQYPPVAPVIDSNSIQPSGSIIRVSAPDHIGFRMTDPSLSGIQLSSVTIKAVDQIGREIPLITAGVVESGLTGYIAPADTAGIGGDPVEIQVHIDWPNSIKSGQRYDMTVDATNNVGESL